MKRQKSILIFVLLTVAVTAATALAQAVPESPQERELERAAEQVRLRLQVERIAQGGGARSAVPAPGQTVQTPFGPVVAVRENRTYTGGAWWTNTALIERLGITDEQKAKIERAYENHRERIVSTTQALEKEEAQLAKLLEAEQIDRNALHAQIDRVIQARGEMERTNAAMTLEMREALTRAQWVQLPQPTANVRIMQLPEGAGLRSGGERSGGGRGARGAGAGAGAAPAPPGQRTGGRGQQ